MMKGRGERRIGMNSHPTHGILVRADERRLLLFLGILGCIALADTIIITIHHFIPGPPPDFAYSFGIPTAPVGIALYLVIIGLIYSCLRYHKAVLFRILFALLTFEFVVAILAFYQQTFVLQFFCEYAYLYVTVSVLMFIIALILIRVRRTGMD